MFDITGDDIARLTDGDLRTLVARLAATELTARRLPLAALTAGGHQDAKDGGIDVRVDVDGTLSASDFVPRAKTGFQVKKPDMPASAITGEMRPKGELRPAIIALANDGGAYIIVSAQGSLTDTALSERRQAIRDALHDLPNAAALFSDFYDRDRLATWVNQIPGISLWVRTKLGSMLSGWRPIGRWSDAETAEDSGYLISESARLIDERSKDAHTLTIPEALDRLRISLAEPRQCIRLIGMSGLGKTRLVQALFEAGVGSTLPLDPALSIYTDYSDDIMPSAREMARRLVDGRQRAILIVDNCNPAIHGDLVRICSVPDSAVSLITVEYDVRDDEPEQTDVFRLTCAANAIVEKWLERDFPHVSQVDRSRITEFSDGNFRVARALADTLRHGETLGQLRSQDLFERIFYQRNTPDRQLLHDAEILALLYSFDGEIEDEDGELDRLARFARRTKRDLFASIAELRRRGIIQARGRWRAVLPQAIANRLAVSSLGRVPAGEFDHFCSSLPARMLKSLSRRLGYLHDSAEAQAAVARWMQPQGPLGDLFALGEIGLQIISNVAPVAPDIVLAKIEVELDGPNGSRIVAATAPGRGRWTALLKALAYEPAAFEASAMLLARFVAAEARDSNNNSAAGIFEELFHLYLSGTMASPAHRRALAEDLLASDDSALQRAGEIALDGMLEATHFTSTSNFDFGARPRDYGWHPHFNQDIYDWFDEAIKLAVRLADTRFVVKSILARNVRGLWYYGGCQDALDEASKRFAAAGGWIDGWISFRTALRFDGQGMPDEMRARLLAIVERLKPTDLLDRARAYVLSRVSGGYDVADGEDDDAVDSYRKASQAAVDIGKAMAGEKDLLTSFLDEVVLQNPPERSYEFGCGVADGANDLQAAWDDTTRAFCKAPPDARNATVLGGFIGEAFRIDAGFAGAKLEAAMDDPCLGKRIAYLQSQASLDPVGLDRLRRAVSLGHLGAVDFACLACGVIRDTEAEPLIAMLDSLAALDGGIGQALDVLHMRLYCAKSDGIPIPEELIAYGRDLLKRADFLDVDSLRDYGLRTIVKVCFAGPCAREDARIVCQHLRAALEDVRVSAYDAQYLLESLFKAQPEVALDEFLLDGPPQKDHHLFYTGFRRGSPLEALDAETLGGWADRDPEIRYPCIGDSISLYAAEPVEEPTALSPLFLKLLDHAPDKQRFLGGGFSRLRPSGWSGSLAAHLEHRKSILQGLADHPDADVQVWLKRSLRQMDDWIAAERVRESNREESFE